MLERLRRYILTQYPHRESVDDDTALSDSMAATQLSLRYVRLKHVSGDYSAMRMAAVILLSRYVQDGYLNYTLVHTALENTRTTGVPWLSSQ